jgi:DNA-binding transcriptional regulator YhcF (GntR family)
LHAGVNRMEFYIDKHSSIPVAGQIQEQIKLAVMAGDFRNGDTLPSIRDIEKQTGVNRSHIHKAYLALRESGLLVLTRGKGTVIAMTADSPRSVDDHCRKLSRQIVSKVRHMGLSPIAFARYLSRLAQESERKMPFIVYADSHEEIAAKAAEEISQLWHVPVIGVAYHDLKTVVGRGSNRRKILVSHLMCDSVRSMLPGNKSDVIPIEVIASEQTLHIFDKIKPHSSVLIIHLPQPQHRIEFILAGIRKIAESRDIKIFPCPVSTMSHFRKVVKNSNYEYYIVGPGVRGEVPPELRQNPKILQINPQFEPASLEAARIRAGVII